MKKAITITVFVLLAPISNIVAQYTFDWMKSSGSSSKTAVMSAVDLSDHLIVTGYWQNYQTFTRKYDNSGNLLWEVADSTGIQSKYEKPNWINCDADNNILVVGNQYSYSSSTGWDYPDAIVAIKYSPSGVLLWKTVISVTITLTPLHRFNTSSRVDNHGNLYIGTSVDIPSGATLFKLGPNGNLIFTRSSTMNSPHNFSSLRYKDDKIVVATGSTTTNVAPVFVWDTTGVLLWTAAATGRGVADVEIDESNSVYALSHLMNAVSPTSGADLNITKFNSSGIQLWNHDYDFGGFEFPTRFVYQNNRISIIGYGPSSPTAAYSDWKILQTDTAGALLWQTIYDSTTFNDEIPYHLFTKTNGEIIVTGKGGPSPDPNNPSYIQMAIVQYSNTGNQLWVDTPNEYGGWGLACMLASDASLYAISSTDMTVYHYLDPTVSIENISVPPSSINAYPNPFSSFTTLELSVPGTKNVSITIINSTGNSVLHIPNHALMKGLNKINLDLQKLSKGIYFCLIRSGGNVEMVKLLKN